MKGLERLGSAASYVLEIEDERLLIDIAIETLKQLESSAKVCSCIKILTHVSSSLELCVDEISYDFDQIGEALKESSDLSLQLGKMPMFKSARLDIDADAKKLVIRSSRIGLIIRSVLAIANIAHSHGLKEVELQSGSKNPLVFPVSALEYFGYEL